MDTAPLKAFATSARTELIREVTARIMAVLSQSSPERVERPNAVTALERAIAAAGGGDKGKAHVADKVAYTWFNRIIALRFMDANGYTGIGVVSPAADQVGQPEVLAAAKRGQLDTDVVKSRNAATVTGLLNGTRQPRPGADAQAEAYALLLTDYCRHWNAAMPFMFERDGDYTELLIPANLLADDSVLNRSVVVLTEEVCQDVEVIGWLYQFYISERKEEVFAGFRRNEKAGADEVPAATQLFTPHWIVRYLVENSVGRLWMLNHPTSALASQMDYYIAPVDKEAEFLKISKPEELKVIDPACGSGHMLTYAFDLLYVIYEEEGYAPSEIPGLILTNNLYGTEIDPRAGSLAAFALTMKAAAKRKLFLKNPIEPNICVLDPIRFSADELSYLVTREGDRHAEEAFWNQFSEADTLGSLIQPDPVLVSRLADHLETLNDGGDIYKADAIEWALRALTQATYLLPRYAVVVANPPYMGSSNMAGVLETYIQRHLPDSKADLFATFIERALTLTVPRGQVAMIAKQNWLFRPAFSALRKRLLARNALHQVLHFGAGAFDSLSGEIASTAAFVLENGGKRDLACWFARLVAGVDEAAKERDLRLSIAGTRPVYTRTVDEFLAIPGAPVCYWMSDAALVALASGPYQGDLLTTREGMATGNNARYLRFWWEVSNSEIGRNFPTREAAKASRRRWFPYNKAGGARRWYGLDEYVVDWANDGHELQTTLHPKGNRIWAHNFNLDYIFRECVSWSSVTSKGLALRYYPVGFLFADAGPSAFDKGDRSSLFSALAFANSGSGSVIADLLNPTHHFKAGDFARLPAPELPSDAAQELVEAAVSIAESDWNTHETAPGFVGSLGATRGTRVADWVSDLRAAGESATDRLVEIEARIQSLVSRALGEKADDTPVSDDRGAVTLRGNAAHQFAGALDVESAAQSGLVSDLVSFAVGCMFGRYALDEPGLILADQGATLQDYFSKVPTPTFTPDADNVLPIVDGDWFEDDAFGLFRRFLRTAFGDEHFEENLKFVTESLSVKSLRDYFITRAGKSKFYDDHVQRYKKRPIYWLFSSPKGSFNALMYMHRYTPSTASTVLTYLREYVTKLESALQEAERVGNAKEADRLRKILVELNEYERDTLYPLASQNVVIDLDDGVKVNYPKCGAALKKISGLEATRD